MDCVGADDFLNADFWAEICPWLTVAGGAGSKRGRVSAQSIDILPSLIENGFSRVTAASLWGESEVVGARNLCRDLEEGVCALIAAGFPATCIIVYDEAWALAAAVAESVRRNDGMTEHCMLGDWSAFYVDADAGGRGWPAHRDRPMCTAGGTSSSTCGESGDSDSTSISSPRSRAIKSTFNAFGVPTYVTCWIPLSSAPPEASCLYFLPKNADSGFYTGEAAGAEPLALALAADPSAAQCIIGLPVPRASLLVFSHRTLHWGGVPIKGGLGAGASKPAPRIAISFAMAQPSFEAPFLAGGCETAPATHVARAGLAAAQLLSYATQAPLGKEAAALCADVTAAAAAAGFFAPAFEARARATGEWARFSTSFSHSKYSSAGKGSVSAATVDLLFCARAAADAGLSLSGFS